MKRSKSFKKIKKVDHVQCFGASFLLYACDALIFLSYFFMLRPLEYDE